MITRIRRTRVSIWHIALLLPWLVAAVGFQRSFNDNSYLWHVRAGDLQSEVGSVLTADPFSFTLANEPWRTQSWLAELVYSRVDAWWGLTGTPLITALSAALLFVLMGIIAYRRSRSLPSVAVFLVLTTLLFAAFLNPRPVVISFPLFAGVVVADEDTRLRWALPLLLWTWAAVHGSFAIGLAFLALRAFGRGPTRRSMVELLAIGIPTLLTAHGWGIFDILVAFGSSRDALSYMTEWQTPDLLSAPFLPLFLGILAFIALAARGKLARGDWWLLVPFLALSLTAARAVPPAWIALAPIVGRFQLPLRPTGTEISPVVAGLAGMTLILGPLVIPFDVTPPQEGLFPIAAAEHLETDRVFHDDVAGAWLTYTQWPGRLTYIDDRAEFFEDRIGLMADLRGGIGDWETEFEAQGIDEALLGVSTPLTSILRAEGWLEAYEDDDFVVLRRP